MTPSPSPGSSNSPPLTAEFTLRAPVVPAGAGVTAGTLRDVATDLAHDQAPGRRLQWVARVAHRPRTAGDWAQAIATTLVLVGCVVFTFLALHPSKLFLNTTPAGGDMGAHVWAPWFLKNHLFPHGRISGWAPDWYDGFPALTYYFPGPYLVIALLSYVIPYGVAFKLVSVSGVLGLPLAAYALGRLLGMRFPGPALLAVSTVPFLFDRYFTIWGGNIASTLAGEFAFSIGLCLALLFIGVFSYSMRTGRYRWLAALLLAGTLFCHLLPTFFAVAGGLLVWLLAPGRRRLWRALAIGISGFAVTAWWLLPFVVRLGYSNDMGWERSTAFMKGLFPFLCNTHKTDASVNCPAFGVTHVYTVHLEVVVALAAAGLIGALILRRRSTLLLAGLGLVFAAAFRFMPQGTLWNARMLPFWYLSLYLVAATCLSESALAIGILFGRVPSGPGQAPGIGGDLTPLPTESPRERHLVGAGARHAGGGSGWGDPGDNGGNGGPGDHGNGGGAGEWGSHTADGGHAPWADGLAADGGWGGEVDWGAGDWDPLYDVPEASPAGGGWPPADDAMPPDEAELVPNRWPAVIAPLLVCAFVLTFVGQSISEFQGFFNHVLGHHFGIGGAAERASVNPTFVTSWADWNYSGYQEKPAYPEYKDIVDTMARVGKQYGCGRAMWEYEPEEDQFGTPMALMLLPMWTNECIGSEEGLFFESSATVPYHFLNQSELSANPSRAMRDLPYRNYDIVDGIKHMQLLGVRYYMAVSPTAQTAAQTLATGPNPLLRLVAQTGTHDRNYTQNGSTTAQARHWQIYEIAGSDPVSGLSYLPAVMQGVPTTSHGWINTVVPWYQDPSRWPVELAASGPSDWPRIRGASATPPHVAVPIANVSGIKMTDDRISFDVDRTGTPVLVKTSWFPNWQATGANGPWRVAPNLMVVVPTSRHVELHYGFTPVDNLGRIVSVGGLAAVALLGWGERGARTAVPDDGAVPAEHGPGNGGMPADGGLPLPAPGTDARGEEGVEDTAAAAPGAPEGAEPEPTPA